MRMIQEIYKKLVTPWQNDQDVLEYETKSCWTARMELENILLERMKGEDKELLHLFLDAVEDYEGEVAADHYEEGFRFGALLMMELFTAS